MGVSLNLNPRIRYSDLGGEQQRRANEDAYWHKADMPHTATNVCFWQKSGRVYNLRVVERTDTLPRSGIKPGLRPVSLENGNNAEDEQRLLAR